MNIAKLFETQRALDAHILEKHPAKEGEDRLVKKILALLVEMSELANEWRGFKFWSHNQEPRTKLFTWIDGLGECKESLVNPQMLVENGQFNAFQVKNPLLEEYVDCLHFIISIGLDLGVNPNELFVAPSFEMISENLFLSVMNDVLTLDLFRKEHKYQFAFTRITELGLSLGFTLDEIEQAYYSKNKINHARQRNNY